MAELETSRSISDTVELFETALKDLLKDRGFQLPGDATKEAVLAASEMLEWITEDRGAACHLLFPIACALKQCIVGLCLQKKSGREKMWRKFHTTRNSSEFIASWAALMSGSLRKSASPLFYQHITDLLFNSLVKMNTPVQLVAQTGTPSRLTYEEENALYYVAGYVVRELKKRQSKLKGQQPLDKELNLCLTEISNSDVNLEECTGDEVSASDWTIEINRGGLKFVNSETYQFFHAMEMAIRRELTEQKATSISAGFKNDVIKTIKGDEDVLFQWSMVASEWDEQVSERLFGAIVELFVTVRGFGFARQWMEGYKQRNKKTTQKSKGVRKQLIGSSGQSKSTDSITE